jgi:hypothetical protein
MLKPTYKWAKKTKASKLFWEKIEKRRWAFYPFKILNFGLGSTSVLIKVTVP